MPTGLPGFLVGSYKRYKSDTNQFLEWLDRTAKECSPPVEPVKIKPSMTPSAKKKARRHWEEKTPVHMKPLPTDKVALSHFITLARVIADSGRQIKVPRLVAVLISRAIALRKQCSAWFLKHGKRDTGANKGHAHFVAVLEKVLRILEEPLSRSEASQDQERLSKNMPKGGIDKLANRFSVLDLDEAEEQEEEVEKIAEEGSEPSKPAAKTTGMVDVDVFDDTEHAEKEEAVFAVFCLFEDLRKLRDFIKQIWQDYKDEKIDLVSAAVTTNTAIDIARQSSEEFLDKNRPAVRLLRKEMPTDDNNLASLFFNFVGKQIGVEPWMQSRNAPWNVGLDEVADYCFLPPISLLVTYTQSVRTPGGDIPTYNKGWAYELVSEVERKDMNPEQRWKEDMEIVLRSMTGFAFLGKGSLPVPGQDELMRGLRRMEQNGATPFWLAFALQSECLSNIRIHMY